MSEPLRQDAEAPMVDEARKDRLDRLAYRAEVERKTTTEAGRKAVFLAGSNTERRRLTLASVIAIETEARVAALDLCNRHENYEQMRKDRGWPTPNHMRSAADALDTFTPARYGDVLRWFADLCDAALSESPEREAPK